MQLTIDLMYEAAVNKDSSFEGIFFTAVKTTGIFCRPTCTARKPKKENVEFFKTAKEAIMKGYRPCKVCHPLEKYNMTPDGIRNILNQLAENPTRKFRDSDLLQMGVEPSTMRRWFLKNHGMTFQAYQRMFRINHAFKRIQRGESITATAFDVGYESLSGFGDSFKSIFGVSPKHSKEQRVIDLKRLETPLGTMVACAVTEGICLLEFTDRKMLETEFKALSKRLNATIMQGDNLHIRQLEIELAEYFAGQRKQFTVPLFTPGTNFQNLVWNTLQRIPYGQTISYKEQAQMMEKEASIRAVANANGMNRVSILIPCHRVIGSDGQLTGYGGGIWRKRALLELENELAAS
ncbi:trifunctional transcriptional activator/DNA repair protein Ada/methylated-DNA--[protein]-cysteine S-methyltransferase [Olivibacter sp. 47]|uniref:bifunctional transcriptional activator/DNA repair enzyme AdaA n=1 Tax=Olivibacter sp. 47 TaxID=3056486 RepID=UPI0025A387D2|nr:trifunctional transcriptional activator/DNA repair protein Ada/methylated-DNA--[protein]-cysteine S-methyltransferase [Olivibacter sp. 47]MDM8172983.1 trifunctional transcriptional activator/DNA repair protein Ada/methylated-DNA--[protein]-cysteine S-methyltransferase [Olivibacter sp. 47]